MILGLIGIKAIIKTLTLDHAVVALRRCCQPILSITGHLVTRCREICFCCCRFQFFSVAIGRSRLFAFSCRLTTVALSSLSLSSPSVAIVDCSILPSRGILFFVLFGYLFTFLPPSLTSPLLLRTCASTTVNPLGQGIAYHNHGQSNCGIYGY